MHRRTPLAMILRSHTTWRIVLFLVIGFTFFRRVSPLMPFTGDEPHYLLGAISLVKDGDFNVYNNYANQDYREFGYEELHPQHPESEPGRAHHGARHRVPRTAGHSLEDQENRRRALYAVPGGACSRSFWRRAAVDLLSGNPWIGSLTALLLGFSPTWLMHSRMVFPECTAGLVTAVISLLLIRLNGDPDAACTASRPPRSNGPTPQLAARTA